MDLKHNLETIQRRIAHMCDRCGRSSNEVQLIAVSKNIPFEQIKKAYELGQKDFGENHAQQLRDKRPLAKNLEIRWHFIGALQSNKVKYVVGHVAYIHSVDSIRLMKIIDQKAANMDTVQKVLLEVNVSGEASKHGFVEEDLEMVLLASKDLRNVSVEGLMTMAPFVDDPERIRWVFSRLRLLRERLSEVYPKLIHLSMGMSGDFEVAVEEGATMVRVGSAIFGERS